MKVPTPEEYAKFYAQINQKCAENTNYNPEEEIMDALDIVDRPHSNKLAVALHDVRMILDHSASICDCPHCEERKKRYEMVRSCMYSHFKLP